MGEEKTFCKRFPSPIKFAEFYGDGFAKQKTANYRFR